MKKRFLRTDAALDARDGRRCMSTTPAISTASGRTARRSRRNRYIDIFVVKDGLIPSTDVWNDSAEILLARAGLAEAPL